MLTPSTRRGAPRSGQVSSHIQLAVCLAIVLTVALAPVGAQRGREPERRAATIRGRVVAAENQQPLRRALVTAFRAFPDGRPAFSDDDGRFEIALASVPMTLTITKGGYAVVSIDITSATVKADRDIEIQLARGGAISGRLLGNTGAPIAGVRVRARRVEAPDANRVEVQDAARNERRAGAAPPVVATLASIEATTDDLGEYRLGGLASGYYEVAAQRPMRPEELRAAMTQLQRTNGGRAPGGVALLSSIGPERVVDIRAGDDVGPVDLVMEGSQIPGLLETPFVTGSPHEAGPQFQLRTLSASEERPGGSLSGTLLDQSGEPLQGVQVRALRLQREDGRVIAQDPGGGLGIKRTTDDRGRYRLFGLPPGRYLVVASTTATPSGLDRAQGNAFTRVYFPATPDVESAQPIQVDEGRETTGVDVSFAPIRAGRIIGRATDAGGEPLIGQVRLIPPQRPGVPAVEPLVERVHFDGSFEITDVPHGQYVLQAVGTNPGHRDEFGFAYVSVDDQPASPVAIRTSVGATLEGRFVVEDVRRPPMRAMSIHASVSDFDRAPSEGRGPDGLAIHDDGRFTLTGLRGSMRLTAAHLPSPWYMKSITIGGLDVTDVPFDFGADGKYTDVEIVLSRSSGMIAGSVTDAASARAARFDAIAFSTDRERWFAGSRHILRARAAANGTFNIGGLPPGEYWVTAVDALSPDELDIPEGLDTLSTHAARVTVDEGSVAEIALRLVSRAMLRVP